MTQTLRGAIYITIAMFILAYTDNVFDQIADTSSVWQFHTLRTLIMLPILIGISFITGHSLIPRRWAPTILRGAFLGIGMIVYFGALGILPIAQVGAGLFTSPMWILIYAVLFSGARVGIFRIFAMLFGFAGVLLILKPDPANLQILSLIPIIAGAFYGLGMFATGRWCSTENTLVLTASMFISLGILGALGLTYFTLFPTEVSDPALQFITRGWTPPTPILWKTLAMQIAGPLIAIGLITRAYQIGDASYVVIFEYTFLIFAALWGYILFGAKLDTLSILGVAMIITSGLVISLRSQKSN